MTPQPDLFTPPALAQIAEHGVTEADQADLRAHLISHGWQTRAQVCAALDWNERKLRAVAESIGADVVRCQRGYKLTDSLAREEFGAALQACDAFDSQARKNSAYAHDLRRRLHAKIG